MLLLWHVPAAGPSPFTSMRSFSQEVYREFAITFAMRLIILCANRLVLDVDDGKSSVEAHLFTLTANRCFWPYMPHRAFHLPRTSLLRVLPRDHQPISLDTNSSIHREDRPVSLSLATWDLFMDVRDAHHERLHDRSLAARKRDRRAQRVKDIKAS